MAKVLNIALLIALISPVWGVATVQYTCRMSGEISRECCCPADIDKEGCSVMEAAGACCDVKVTPALAPNAASRASMSSPEAPLHPAACASLAAVASALPKLPPGYASAVAREFSSYPPPLVVLNQTFRC